MITRVQILKELANLRPNATFLTLVNYTNNSGECATHSIVFNMSYHNALNKSLDIISRIVPANELEAQAQEELLTSFRDSLTGLVEDPEEERDDGYTRFEGVKGVKLHDETETLHIYGLVVHKLVHIPGVYKKVNSRPLTIAKNKMRAKTPVSKFRQYAVLPEKVDSIRVSGLEILPPEED